MISAITIPLVVDYDVTQGSKLFAQQLNYNGYVTMQVVAKGLTGTLNGTVKGQQTIHLEDNSSFVDISSFSVTLDAANATDIVEKTTPLVCGYFGALFTQIGLTGGTISIYLRILPLTLTNL